MAWEPTRVSLRVPREQVSATAARLLGALQVRDLAIQEPDVEDVIRSLFSGKLRDEEPDPSPQLRSAKPSPPARLPEGEGDGGR